MRALRFWGIVLAVLVGLPLPLQATDGSAVAVSACAHSPVACDAEVVVRPDGRPLALASPHGLTAGQLEKAYGIGGYRSDATIALVGVFSDPTAWDDLAVYRRTFGLPPVSASCVVRPCFTQVNESGFYPLPRPDSAWAQEASLDLDMASAACPTCSLLLVDASAADAADLAVAVAYAKSVPGVVSVSNSYGSREDPLTRLLAPAFAPAHAGQWVVASAGDSGYHAQFPADLAGVVAVGGTTLHLNPDGSYRSETAWGGGGSGCSALQRAAVNGGPCRGMRAITDVSAVADPRTGVAVYDSMPYAGTAGWITMGGTSAAAPFIAGVHALAHSPSSGPRGLYAPGASLHDVTAGSNGACRWRAMCHAGRGYDGPTGNGTPDGSRGLTGF